MHSLHRRHLFIALLLLFTLVVNAGVAGFNIARLVRNEQAVARTYAILSQTENIVADVDEIETATRSFVATGATLYQEAATLAQEELEGALDSLSRNVRDQEQKLLLPSLVIRAERLREVSERAIALRRRDPASAQQFLAQKRTQALLDEARELALEVQTREQDILQERADESTDSAQNATRTFWIASGANLLFLGVVLGLLYRASQQNVQLERAFVDLKRAESLRDGLSAMLVHDLRTPLTTLLGPLHLLHAGAMGQLSDSQHELVGMSFQSGERLLKLVNELLDISKMEADELQIEREPVEIHALIRDALREVASSDDKAPQLSIAIAPDLPPVCGERDLLVRVLVNLLGNALKFTPKTGKVSLGAGRDEENVGFARFWVRDSGEGIPAEDLDKIFDKFGQVETRKAGRKMSTGLGLTFCKLAVETHGGLIWVESEVGQGSVFWFTIPFSEKGSADNHQSDSESNAKC